MKLQSWKPYPAEKPPIAREIAIYPVIYTHADLGRMVDMAEYHPDSPIPWRLIGDGWPVTVSAWMDIYPLPDH